MEKHWSAVCALVALAALVHIDMVLPAETEEGSTGSPPKPGDCPSNISFHPMLKICDYDEDCPADLKCCKFRGGALCFKPAFKKPGQCPKSDRVFGHCAEFCYEDSDCPGLQKCCSNGCGHDCMLPAIVKPGRCPLPERVSIGAKLCFGDSMCPGEQKCCERSCGPFCARGCCEPCD